MQKYKKIKVLFASEGGGNISEVRNWTVIAFSEDESEGEVRHEVQLKAQKCRVFYGKLTYIYLKMPRFNKTEEDL